MRPRRHRTWVPGLSASLIDRMPSEPIKRLRDFARSREYECEIVGEEARVFMANGVSVRARVNELGQLSFRPWFGRMPAIYEMATSITLFAALLIFALANRSGGSHPYLPDLAIIVFIGNASFEISRLWKAKRFISEAQRA
jgi:hypothetical protein